jgi:ribose transport system substrate-binding protein
MASDKRKSDLWVPGQGLQSPLTRRSFLKRAGVAGLALAVPTVAASCGDETTDTTAATAGGTATTAGGTATTAESTVTTASAAQTPVDGMVVVEGTPWVDTTEFKKDPPWVFGFSNPSLSNEWRVYELALMEAWVENNKDLVKDFYSTDAQDNPVKQIADTKDLMVKGIDILLSSPGTPAANPGQEAAFKKGLPVVQFDRTGETEQYTSILLVDEVLVGQKITKWLCEALGGKGNIVCFSGVAGSWPSEGRLVGMKQVLLEYPDVKVVGGPVYTAWAAAPAKKAMEDWMGAGLKIDGIWSDSGMMARPAYEAWLAGGKDPIPAVGDSYNGWLKFVKENKLEEITHGVWNVPLWIGVAGIETAVKILKGEPVPRTSYFTVEEIDASNIDDYVRMDLSDSYFGQDYVPGKEGPPEELKKKIFALKS